MSTRDRRPRFRAAVYAPREGMKNSCRVVLLRMSDGMNHKGIVSIPRTKLADELGVHPSRITEAVTLARKLGFLDVVRRGRPGVTAVYQGLIPAPSMVRQEGGDLVRPSAPSTGTTWCAPQVSQVGNAERESERTPAAVHRDVGSNEKAIRTEATDVSVCEYHLWQTCPVDCRNFDRRSA